ncbi:hypothetical protein BDZ94DRAFT_30288 [Collybia nuda]|uniref:PEHE domain-containing protein n=1 Tax=Collybia nuda TaxID=64659 RepID=A0A9P5YH58_9AGAR|nr:hypothetical protein BDZ94DRAFT_30288 [Collybia nuda]
MDAPSTSANVGSQSRQKRVLPSRSRRGGPGVGNCDTDIMILETQKRRFGDEPLIPVETKFLLTTNPEYTLKTSSITELGVNIHANDRYFDRPEVLKSYREQEIIQTPDFVNTAEVPTVGGRFRARNVEDGTIDTSDAAYEKRHRKYETFEKRQRLREKEKLKHEQYKLKERIEQLRAMDGAAFLSLPASSFSSKPASSGPDSDNSDRDLSGSHVNGAASYREGERRRREMLQVASMLEERYRVLLPPDRIRKAPGQSHLSVVVEPDYPVQESPKHYEPAPESEVEEVSAEAAHREALKLKIKVPKRHAAFHSAVPTPASVSSKKRKKSIPPLPKQTHVARRIKANYQPYRAEEMTSIVLENTDRPSSPSPTVDRTSPQSEIRPESTDGTTPHTGQDGEPPAEPPAPLPPPSPLPIPELTTEVSPLLVQEELKGEVLMESLSTNPVISRSTPPAPSMEPEEASSLEPEVASRPTTPMSNPDIAILESGSPNDALVRVEAPLHPTSDKPLGAIYVTRPIKRVKVSPSPSSRNVTREPSIPPIESISAPMRRSVSRPSAGPAKKQHVSYAGAAGKAERTNSVLMVAAIRSSGNSARKAKRHLNAFGSKLRNEVFDETRDFVLPSWVLSAEEYEKRSRALSPSVVGDLEFSIPSPSQDPSQILEGVS